MKKSTRERIIEEIKDTYNFLFIFTVIVGICAIPVWLLL